MPLRCSAGISFWMSRSRRVVNNPGEGHVDRDGERSPGSWLCYF